MLESDNRDLLLDDNNSLVIRDGDLVFSTGIQGVMQECRIKMLMFKGEWFLDREVGVSWWSEILGQKPDRAIAAMTSEFSDKLASVEDVIVVNKLDISYDGATRRITVSWSVTSRFGDTPVDELPIPI